MEKISFASTNKLIGNILLPNKKIDTGLLFLHGGGEATKERYTELQEQLAQNGFASFAFDFRGCGESEGEFQDGSLQHRLIDAQAAYDKFHQNVKNIILVGCSMGGHIAVRLTETRNVYKLILLYSAAYALEAEDKQLNQDFTDILRRENSWKNSPAFSAIEKYKSDVLIIYGENDVVVPKEVQNTYKALIKTSGKFISLPNAPHLFLKTSSKQVFQEMLEFLNN